MDLNGCTENDHPTNDQDTRETGFRATGSNFFIHIPENSAAWPAKNGKIYQLRIFYAILDGTLRKRLGDNLLLPLGRRGRFTLP